MSLKFPTFSRRFRTLLSLGGPILYGLVGSLGHARLTAIKSAFGLDILLVYTRNLLEKVGNLRDIAVLVQLNVEFHVANENWPSPMFMSI